MAWCIAEGRSADSGALAQVYDALPLDARARAVAHVARHDTGYLRNNHRHSRGYSRNMVRLRNKELVEVDYTSADCSRMGRLN